ncbi:MAG: hypothetical protein HC913_06480 [Microscillaceae bacterium]|nr:hypothetical protein [Microscillaceae bacterium]
MYRNLLFAFMLCLGGGMSALAQTEDDYYQKACCSGLGDEEAIKALDEGIKKYPKSALLYMERANVKSRALSMTNPVDKNGMMADYDKAVSLDPNSIEVYMARGNGRVNLAQYKAALEDFDKALAIAQKNQNVFQQIDVYNNRANAKRFLNDLPGVYAEYEAVLKIDKEGAPATRALMAGIKTEMNDFAGAIKEYSTAISLYEKLTDYDSASLASCYENRGLLYIEQLKKKSRGLCRFESSLCPQTRR